MSISYEPVHYIQDLTQDEKDWLLKLILDRLGVDVFAYKFDGESSRSLELRSKQTIGMRE